MKKSRSETAQTRGRIVRAAALAFRSNGIHATGIAEIMSAAGLTPGGFYRHFASKEHLIAEACAAGMESTIESIDACARVGEQAFVDHFEACLRNNNRKNTLIECPLIAMGSELVRADAATRRAATHGYRALIDVMTSVGASDEESAMFAFSAMLGALTIARIVDDPELAGLILHETKKRVTGLWAVAPEAQGHERP